MSASISGIDTLGSISSIGSLQPQSLVANDAADEGFGGLLSNAANQLGEANAGAQAQIGNVLAGGDADLSSVMVAVEKADVAFQLAMQVRNKIVNAYQDIEKMQF